MEIRTSVLIVNLNNLIYTKNCINDLLLQDEKINLTIVDQNSEEDGTHDYYKELQYKHLSGLFYNSINSLTIIKNNHNKPLNHVWNDFVSSCNTEFFCLLNNDIRLLPNFISSSTSVLDLEPEVSIINHTTNHCNYINYSPTLSYDIKEAPFRQGWDTFMRTSDWEPIPHQLEVFYGDDFIYSKVYNKGKKGAYVLNSPIIHYERATTVEKKGRRNLNIDHHHYKLLPNIIQNMNFDFNYSRGGWKFSNYSEDTKLKYNDVVLNHTINTFEGFKSIINEFSTIVITGDENIQLLNWFKDNKKTGSVILTKSIDEIINSLHGENRTLVLCDGENQLEIFNKVGEYLKENDVIMIHGFCDDIEYYSPLTKILNWTPTPDVYLDDISNAIHDNNLSPYKYFEFRNMFWGSFTKESKTFSKDIVKIKNSLKEIENTINKIESQEKEITSSSKSVIINNGVKFEKSFLIYATENYFDIAVKNIESIRKYSNLPIFLYLVNSNKKLDIKNTYVINWSLKDLNDLTDRYVFEKDNFYINRKNKSIYNILIQKPLVVKDALEKYSEVVSFVDCDSVATDNVENMFEFYNSEIDYPYFVEGIHDYLHINGRGGAMSRDDLSTTLEHPSCELFNVNQYVRQKYRQTGYFVSNQKCLPFLEEWYWMCNHPSILNDVGHYAAYNEETILNVLLWKKLIFNGLPYLYTNGGVEVVNHVYNNTPLTNTSWIKFPSNQSDLMFFHGEKNTKNMDKMISIIEKHNKEKIKLLFLAPHLSTGGMPSFLLKRIESLLTYYKDKVELYVIEYSNHSDHFVVQKNRIKDLIPSSRFWTLSHDKNELIKIIEENSFDIIHLDEMIEAFDFHNRLSNDLMNFIYKNDRTWRVVETCHNVIFKPDIEKKFHPEAYAYCSPFHKEVTFKNMPSYGEVIEFPYSPTIVLCEKSAKEKLGLDPNKTHIINVGLWTSGKNQGEGVEIARLVQETHPELEFHFIGNQAPNFQEYWEPIMNNLPTNVRVWGERNDVSDFMSAADVLMFNSTWECNPLVLREGISYGLKILSRNLPQYMDMFTPYIKQISGSIHDMKDQLLDLLKDEEVYEYPKYGEKEFADKNYNLYQQVLNNPIKPQIMLDSEVQVYQNFVGQPFLEIKGTGDKDYVVRFFNEDGSCPYENTIKPNHWVRLNKRYYTKWKTVIRRDNQIIYENILDLTGRRVYIAFDSKSLGDSIAWIPYVLEFQKKHNCKVIVSTFLNDLFEKEYPEIEFVTPGTPVPNLYAMYSIGWFYDRHREPEVPNTIPLQKTITNILGLEYKEILPKIHHEQHPRPYKNKYVTIATNSTAGCKFWTREAWQVLINYLHNLGYKVINVSKEDNPFENANKIKNTSMAHTINVINHSEFFIGLSSGLSWLAWGLGKQIVMISNFTEPDHEFTTNCTRIINKSVCNGCWNKPEFTFSKSNWNWCPVHEATSRQFECHTSITAEMVINQIQHLIK